MSELRKRLNKTIKALSAMEGGKTEVQVWDWREVLKCMAMYDAALIMKDFTDEPSSVDCECSIKSHMETYGDLKSELTQLMLDYRAVYLEKMFKKHAADKAKGKKKKK